jgi:hypothetical protein
MIAVAAAVHGACGGSVILEEGAGGSGGSGGSGGEGNSTQVSTTSAGTTSPGPSAVTSVGTGPMACVGCAEFITAGQGTLCPQSESLYKELLTCVCAELCIPQCGNNLCSGSDAAEDCFQCVTSACQDQFNSCTNDF